MTGLCISSIIVLIIVIALILRLRSLINEIRRDYRSDDQTWDDNDE